MLQVQVMMMREEYDAAGKLLAEANKLSPKNLQIMRTAVGLATN